MGTGAEGLHVIDAVIIILSLLVSLWIGFYFSRGQKTTNKLVAAWLTDFLISTR